MRKVASLVVLLYALIIIVLTIPVLFACFFPEIPASWIIKVFSQWIFWVWFALMLLCQVILLFVPLKIADGRPVARRNIYPAIIASGFLMACLFFGILCSIAEFLQHNPVFTKAWQGWSALGVSLFLWFVWAVIFSGITRNMSPGNVVSTQSAWLLKGSLLALLIAVPTHIVARHRNYCCAGFGTFVGIAFGIGIMLLSFGPGVFFLYAERWKKLHPK